MHIIRSLSLGLALTSLSALGAARPAAAQDLRYTLSGVAFNDGGEAFGFFDYNPSTNLLGDYALFTTSGATAFGSSYNAEDAGPFLITDNTFDFLTDDGSHLLALFTTATITSPGVYSLYPGTILSANEISGSGELTPTGPRVVLGASSGQVVGAWPEGSSSVNGPSLVVTFAPAAVPEASTTVSLGLLLALGLGGGVIAAKRKKAGSAS